MAEAAIKTEINLYHEMVVYFPTGEISYCGKPDVIRSSLLL